MFHYRSLTGCYMCLCACCCGMVQYVKRHELKGGHIPKSAEFVAVHTIRTKLVSNWEQNVTVCAEYLSAPERSH